MQHILNDVFKSMTDQIVSEMGQKIGLNTAMTRSLIEEAVPSIIGGLAHNAKKKEGAEALTQALKKDHDGSILDKITDLVKDPEQFNASKMLGHILGNKESMLTQMIGNNLKMDSSTVQTGLKVLAPIIMGKLGKHLSQNGLSAGDLQKTLKVARKDAKKGNKANALLISFLDKDGDGDVKDDLFKVAMKGAKKWMSRKKA